MSLEGAGRELTAVEEGLDKMRTHVAAADDAFARTYEKIETIIREPEATVIPLLKSAETSLTALFQTMDAVYRNEHDNDAQVWFWPE
jgi:hypothetical protein